MLSMHYKFQANFTNIFIIMADSPSHHQILQAKLVLHWNNKGNNSMIKAVEPLGYLASLRLRRLTRNNQVQIKKHL